MELAVIKAELERGWGGTGINDSTNGCSVETVDLDGTASLSSVFITLQGEREGAVSIVHPSNLRLQHQEVEPPQLSADRPVSLALLRLDAVLSTYCRCSS